MPTPGCTGATRNHAHHLVPNRRSPASPRPGHDVAVLVQVLVDGGRVDGHVGVALVEVRHPLGRGDQADEADRLGLRALDPIDGRDGRVAGGQQRVGHDARRGRPSRPAACGSTRPRPASRGRGRCRCARRAPRAGCAACRRRCRCPRAGWGSSTIFLPSSRTPVRLGERRLDLGLDERQIAGDLVGEQHADLGDQVAERAGADVLLPQQRQLVLHQRVGDDVDLGGHMVVMRRRRLRTPCRRCARAGAGRRRRAVRPRARGRRARCRPPAPWPAAAASRPGPDGVRSSAATAIEQRHGQRAPLDHHRRTDVVDRGQQRRRPRHQHAAVEEQPAVAVLGQARELVEVGDRDARAASSGSSSE